MIRSLRACNTLPWVATISLTLLVGGLKAAPPAHLAFVQNKGQMRDAARKPTPDVLFRADAENMSIYITRKGLVYVSTRPESDEREEEEERAHLSPMKGRMSSRPMRKVIDVEQEWVEVDLVGADIDPARVVVENERPEHADFFLRHCPQGIYDVRSYERVTFLDVYPGIDLKVYSTDRGAFKYDLVVHAGADASLIRLVYGARRPIVADESGGLRSCEGKGMSISEAAPITYAEGSGERIANAYVVERTDKHHTAVHFTLDAIDPVRTRVIDPQVTWCTFMATELLDGPLSITTTANGDVLVTGYDGASPGFPQGVASGNFSAAFTATVGTCFLRAFSSAGVLRWSTLYDAAIFDQVTTNSAGHILLVGSAYVGFPTQAGTGAYAGAFLSNALASGELTDGCIVAFSSTGTRLWATYLGGTQMRTVASDAAGNMLLAGTDLAGDITTQAGTGVFAGAYAQAASAGVDDVVFMGFAPNGARIWSTYFGGNGSDLAGHITRRSDGRWYISGYSTSNNLSTQAIGSMTGAYVDATYNGLGDGLLVGLSTNGALEWCTYFGGTHEDGTCGVACSAQNDILVTGLSASSDFPVLAGTGNYANGHFDNTMEGGQDAFVAAFAPNGTQQWTTYIGGSNVEGNGPTFNLGSTSMEQIALDTCGNIIVVFNTGSADMPTPVNSCTPTTDNDLGAMGFEDIYLMRLTPNGSLNYGTYIGGSGYEFRPPFALDHSSNSIFLSAETSDQFYANDFPLVDAGGGAYFDNTLPDPRSDDSFILKFSPAPCEACNVPMVGVEVEAPGCYGACDGTAVISVAHAVAPFTYAWSNGLSSSNASGLCSGSYTVTVTDANGHTASITFNVPSPIAPGTTVTSTTSSCTQATGTATISGLPFGATVLWGNGQSTPTATGLAPGIYTVVTTDTAGCIYTDTVAVNGISTPVASAVVTADPIMAGESTQLVGLGGSSFLWSPAAGLSCTACASPIASPTDTTTYCVTVFDGNNCSDSACITVHVLRPCSIYLPNAFSPNASSKNDLLCVYGDCISVMMLRIFDRWGNKVFESADPSVCWDGLHNGEPANPGVFVYMLSATLTSGESVEKQGNITLVR